MQVWKKVLSTLLALALLLSCCPAITLTASAAEVDGKLIATFTFGANGSASHNDGTKLNSSMSYTDGEYTLALTNCTNIYGGARDAKGNSVLKFGASSSTGSLTFSVADDVIAVVLRLAKYKSNTSKCTINGTAYTLTKNSNDGNYDEIVVDTTATKSITIKTVSGGYRMMMDSVSFYKAASGEEPEVTEPAETEPVETEAPTEAPTVPAETEPAVVPEGRLAIFEFGENAAGGHKDNNTAMTSGKVSYTDNGYTITFNDCASVYDKCNDEKGNSAIKFGTGSKSGSLTFTVADDVDYIVIKLAKYKANESKYSINGGEAVSLTKSSNNGEYDEITVDTTTQKTVTIATVSGGYRMMMDSIAFYSNAGGTMPELAATVVLTPSKTEVKRGESFDVVVSVTEADAYTSMGFIPSVDGDIFEITDAASLEGANSASAAECTIADGGVLVFNDPQAATGNMFRFTLTVKDDTPFGVAVFTGVASAKNGTQPLKVTLVNAEVTVVCAHETLIDFVSVDNDTHKYSCDDCGQAFTAAHNFGGWAELDQSQHGKTCQDCNYVLTEAHIFEDGLCVECVCMEEYTVVFKNYDGTILHEETYYYADTIIEPEITPAKPADEVYSYVFAGWTPEFEEVTGDAEYVAVYEAVYVEYTVTFLDRNGEVLQTGVYHYGDPVTAPEAPAGYHDSKNLYTFSQWNKAVTEVTGNAVYTAQYEISGIRGDFDGDGKLTDRDAIYLLRCTLGMPNYELTQSGDVDGDGQTTDADVVYMLRHILFANRYPLY